MNKFEAKIQLACVIAMIIGFILSISCILFAPHTWFPSGALFLAGLCSFAVGAMVSLGVLIDNLRN